MTTRELKESFEYVLSDVEVSEEQLKELLTLAIEYANESK